MAYRPPYVRAAVKIAALTLFMLAIAASCAQAQDKAASQSRQFSAKAGGLVLEAQTLMNNDQYSPALTTLGQAILIQGLTPYERSIILQMQGGSHYELGDYARAITDFKSALSAGGLAPKEAENLNLQLAQIMIANQQYGEGAQRLESLINGRPSEANKYSELLVQAWLNAKKYNKALPWAKRWFDGAAPKDRKHFNILNFLYHELGYPEQQAQIVMEMIERWPEDADLWTVWASLFSQAGQDEDAFEVSRLRYLGGAITEETELLKIVQYYSFYDMPFQAAQILEKEINAGRIAKSETTLEQLSSLWRQSREYARAIPVLEEATTLSDKASLHAQFGEALYNEGQCSSAETAFIKAIDRGYGAGKAWMLIGTCRYEEVQRQDKLNCEMNQQEKAAAPVTKGRTSTVKAFENVPAESKQSHDAQKWISLVKAERLTFDKQCEVKERIRKDECFKEIKRAYDNIFIEGQFTLGAPTCQVYVAEFDKTFKRQDAG